MHRNVKRAGIATALAAATAVTFSVGTASAINPVPCGNRTDFAMIWSAQNDKYCFANAGTWNIRVEARYIASGNNVLSVRFSDNTKVTLQRDQIARAWKEIIRIHIA